MSYFVHKLASCLPPSMPRFANFSSRVPLQRSTQNKITQMGFKPFPWANPLTDKPVAKSVVKRVMFPVSSKLAESVTASLPDEEAIHPMVPAGIRLRQTGPQKPASPLALGYTPDIYSVCFGSGAKHYPMVLAGAGGLQTVERNNHRNPLNLGLQRIEVVDDATPASCNLVGTSSAGGEASQLSFTMKNLPNDNRLRTSTPKGDDITERRGATGQQGRQFARAWVMNQRQNALSLLEEPNVGESESDRDDNLNSVLKRESVELGEVPDDEAEGSDVDAILDRVLDDLDALESSHVVSSENNKHIEKSIHAREHQTSDSEPKATTRLPYSDVGHVYGVAQEMLRGFSMVPAFGREDMEDYLVKWY